MFLIAMKRCLPKKMAPTWEEIKAYAQGQSVKRQSIAQIFSTEFWGLQFNVLDTVLEFCLQCFLNEAGYRTGVLPTLLTGGEGAAHGSSWNQWIERQAFCREPCQA